MSTDNGSTGVEVSGKRGSPSKPPAKRASVKKDPVKKGASKRPVSKKIARPQRGEVLVWSVHFPPLDEDSPEQSPSTLTASVRLDDQEGAIVLAKPAHPIDYQSGVIRRGSPVEVRYEDPEAADSQDNPVMIFELIDVIDSATVDSDAEGRVSADSGAE